MWGEEERPALLSKMKGSGVMDSEFVDEHDGYLRLTDKQFSLAKVHNLCQICTCMRHSCAAVSGKGIGQQRSL